MRARRLVIPAFDKWFASGTVPGYPRPPIEECLPFDFTTQLRRMRI